MMGLAQTAWGVIHPKWQAVNVTEHTPKMAEKIADFRYAECPPVVTEYTHCSVLQHRLYPGHSGSLK